jgi:hypothetical protein
MFHGYFQIFASMDFIDHLIMGYILREIFSMGSFLLCSFSGDIESSELWG